MKKIKKVFFSLYLMLFGGIGSQFLKSVNAESLDTSFDPSQVQGVYGPPPAQISN